MNDEFEVSLSRDEQLPAEWMPAAFYDHWKIPRPAKLRDLAEEHA